MEESTRKLTVDLDSMVNKDEFYITTHQIFEEFSLGTSMNELSTRLHSPDPKNSNDAELNLIDTDEMISDDEILLKGGYTIQSDMPVNWLPGICFAYEYMKLHDLLKTKTNPFI